MSTMLDVAFANPLYPIQNRLRVVLVEPAGGLNVGAIARVMKNMGLYRLVVVNPQCDVLGDEARQMAVHALDVLERAITVATIPDALRGCQRVVATSARDRDLTMPVDAPIPGLQWLLEPLWSSLNLATTPVGAAVEAAILFGPEDRGLSNAELIYAQRLIMIPSNPDYASLNLAQAVAICCYELYQLIRQGMGQADQGGQGAIATVASIVGEPSDLDSGLGMAAVESTHKLAPVDTLEGFYQHLEQVLLRIGYLYPHTAQRRMEKFRILFNRSDLTQNEVALLRGILRQIEWATQSAQSSADC